MPVRLILLGLLIAQLGDATTFTLGVALHGIQLESNSIVTTLFSVGGLDLVLWTKLAVIVSSLVLLAASVDHFPRLLVWGSAAGTSLGLLGATANLLSLAILAS